MRIRDPRRAALAAVALAVGTALVLAVSAGVAGLSAVPAVLRTGVVAIALFALCGYAAAQTLVRGEEAPHRALMVLPLGAVISALSLAILGLLHVPLKVSLALVIIAAAVSVLWARRQETAPEAPPPATTGAERSALIRVGLPLFLAAMVGLISLVPIFRSGFATVPGQNGDAIMVVGTAVLLEHAPPTATREDLPISHIPLEWRSKYPIYYPLAAVSTLAGQDPIQAFATLAALILALTTLGFFLFARYVLRAPFWISLLALFVVPLDRIVMYVVMHPYYNELWGQFTLPFILLAGWRYLTAPDRRSGALFALFLLLGLLAYPLMVPFPVLFLAAGGVVVWRRRRRVGESPRWIAALELPRPRARPWVWIPVVVVAVPVCLVLVRGFLEKTVSALKVLAPGTDLSGWHGTALGYLPWPRFVGMPGSAWIDYVGMAIVCGLAVYGLTRASAVSREARRPLATMAIVTALIGVYFHVRTDGELFYFKDLAFLGPYLLMLALIALASLATGSRRGRSLIGIAGLLVSLVVVGASAGSEINSTFDNATRSVLALRTWSRELPKGSSIRIDVPPSGSQLWATYMFSSHPEAALSPLGGIFPHPPRFRKADYVVALITQPRPADAVGPVLLRNRQFQLWRMNPRVPGPALKTRLLIYDTSSITIG
ncbi:MAG: hypothetical protein QOD66_2921 [Solirubrobacteraceae bacterium]|nr:hypothetical protein [Solirubrobacteraceae bacterium]